MNFKLEATPIFNSTATGQAQTVWLARAHYLYYLSLTFETRLIIDSCTDL